MYHKDDDPREVYDGREIKCRCTWCKTSLYDDDKCLFISEENIICEDCIAWNMTTGTEAAKYQAEERAHRLAFEAEIKARYAV